MPGGTGKHAVDFSIGVVNYDHGPPSVDQVLADADHAMYAQKRQYRASN